MWQFPLLDFKYFEDPSDEFREQEGTLLPLWKFSYEKVKKLAITSITWSSRYMDLFAVGHGSCEYLVLNFDMDRNIHSEFSLTAVP